MFLKCKILLKRAYAPYTYQKSSAVLTSKDGKEFYGVVVENKVVGATIPAEVSAINNAVAHGYTIGDFDKIYILTDQEKYSFPSYLGIQSIVEFLEKENEIICFNQNGDYKTIKVADLDLRNKVQIPVKKEVLKKAEPEITNISKEDLELEEYKRKYREMFEDSEL